MITSDTLCKQTVVDATYFVSASSCNTIRDFWEYRMSPDQQAEFGNDVRLFSKAVKTRYRLMTGSEL